MIRRPPRSTLFPYTTSSDLWYFHPHRWTTKLQTFESATISRSEEHTSELQSRPHLVCRLLLEKKKKMITSKIFRKKENGKSHRIAGTYEQLSQYYLCKGRHT